MCELVYECVYICSYVWLTAVKYVCIYMYVFI